MPGRVYRDGIRVIGNKLDIWDSWCFAYLLNLDFGQGCPRPYHSNIYIYIIYLRLAAYTHIQSKQGGVDGLRWPKYNSNSLAKYSWKPRRFLIMLMNGHQAASSELSLGCCSKFPTTPYPHRPSSLSPTCRMLQAKNVWDRILYSLARKTNKPISLRPALVRSLQQPYTTPRAPKFRPVMYSVLDSLPISYQIIPLSIPRTLP